MLGLCGQAENADELSFGAYERIVILERDDQYNDGWYQGRNLAGEVGLFPQSYTSPDPPSGSPTGSPAPEQSPDTPEPVMAQHMNEVELALGQLQVSRAGGADGASVHSHVSRLSDDEGDGGPVSNPRAVLALKAAKNAETAAREQRERADRRREEDEAAYAAARGENGLVEGLQMSDESDVEEEEERLPVSHTLAKRTPSISSAKEVPGGDATAQAAAVEVVSPPYLAIPSSSPSLIAKLTEDDVHSIRSRAGTVNSVYADSLHDSPSSAPLPFDGNEFVPPPLPVSSPLFVTSTSSPYVTPPADNASGDPTPVASADATPRPNGHAFSPSTSVPAVGVGIAGAAAAAAVAVAGASSLPSAFNSHTPEPTASLLDEAQDIIHSPTPVAPPTSVTAAPVATPSPTRPGRANGLEARRPTTPSRISTAHTALASATGRSDYAPSPAASLTSGTHSRSSSRLGTAPLTAASTGTGETSPRESTSGSGFGTSGIVGGKLLPYDPRVWGVEEVVEWGRLKGFDALTLSKFQEHEISGDVLLEMDVAMLKEIDLTAFGRRVHIYNAIKELRSRTSPTTTDGPALSRSASSAPLSPGLSGYEPDSPGTTGYASSIGFATPNNSAFIPPGAYTPPAFDRLAGPTYDMGRRESDPGADTSLNGLGFDEQSADLSRSASSGQRSLANGKANTRSRQSMGPPSRTGTTDNYGGSWPHTRSGTMDSFGTSAEGALDEPIMEEKEDEDSGAATSIPPPAKSKGPGTLVIPPRRPNSSRGPASPGASSLTRSDSTTDGAEKTRVKKTSERSSFFSNTLGRSRKPPPKVPSALAEEAVKFPASEGKPRPSPPTPARNKLSASTNSRRSTRLFSAFGGSGSEKGPSSSFENGRRTSSTTSAREGTTAMSTKQVDAAGVEMTLTKTEAVTTGNLLEKIGTPDYSGWMRKKGEKYNTWKQRFFVLKGVHLYYLKSESEQKIKGFINLAGYRVLADSNIHPGEFGFKIVHDTDRGHFFSAAEQVTVRTWMKEIMKATIGRDYSAAVVSSCNIETMPLAVAQSMNPRPRPPSPSTRARVQKERYNGTPNTLTAKDAMILMEFSNSSPQLGSSPTVGGGGRGRPLSAIMSGADASGLFHTLTVEQPTPGGLSIPSPTAVESLRPEASAQAQALVTTPSRTESLLEWVNSRLPPTTSPAKDLSLSLRSGQVLVRLLESLTGTSSGINDADFASYRPPSKDRPFDAAYFDIVFNVFDYIQKHTSTDDVSMDDMMSGKEAQLVLLLERIKVTF